MPEQKLKSPNHYTALCIEGGVSLADVFQQCQDETLEVAAQQCETLMTRTLNSMQKIGREMSSPEVIDRHEKRMNSIRNNCSAYTSAIRSLIQKEGE